MATHVTYVPIAEFAASVGAERASELAKRLKRREIPACYIRRGEGSGLDGAISAAGAMLERGVVPVVELHETDPSMPLRNLGEVACLGTLSLAWSDRVPSFNPMKMLETIEGAGRHRLLIDLLVDPGSPAPEGRALRTFLVRLEKLAKKFGHVQAVKLVALRSQSDEGDSENGGVGCFEMVHAACPKATVSVDHSLWARRSHLRDIASDLGTVVVHREEEGRSDSDPLSAVEYLAKSIGVKVVPRLPITLSYYRKGWYSFEVGKALDAWVDRRIFRGYSERPGWLED